MENSKKPLAKMIIEKSLEFGANLAGISSVAELKNSPSHYIYRKMAEYKGVGTKNNRHIEPGRIAWPENAKSALVVAIGHPEERPALDWWQESYSGGTEGNWILISIIARLAEWLESEKGIKPYKPSYFIERGGIFLKDAAVLAGLGCIGKNNILVTPQYGPRVRLRAMLMDVKLPVTGPIDFDPCKKCSVPCRKACPQKAFQSRIYSKEKFGIDKLPGKSGVFSRYLCNVQMELNVCNCEEIKVEDQKRAKLIKYCRLCEFSCPVGKTD